MWSLIKIPLIPKSFLKCAVPVSLDLEFLYGKFVVLGRLPVVGHKTIFLESMYNTKRTLISHWDRLRGDLESERCVLSAFVG